MDNRLVWLLARLEEPSTWAGGGILALLVTQAVPGPLGTAIIALGAAIGAVLAIVLPEKSP